MEEKFEKLFNESLTIRWRDLDMEGYEEWNDHILEEVGSNENSLKYYDWVRKRTEPAHPDSSLAALAKSISFANWIHENKSTEHLDSVIRENRYRCIRGVQDLQCRYDDFRLGLKVSGRALIPPPTDEDTAGVYGVDYLFTGFVLAIRYARRDNGENEDLLVFPLGRVYFKPISSNDDIHWQDAGLALAVNILRDGTAGNLLIVSTYGNYHDEMDDDPIPPKLPGLPKWIVAQLNETVRLVPQSQKDVDQNIRDKLKIESISKPIIAKTLRPWDNGVLTALFPREKVGQDLEVTEELEQQSF